MENTGYGEPNGSIIKLAQYLARLTTQQDIWIEIGKALVNFLDADLVAFGEHGADGTIVGRHWSFSERVSSRAWPEAKIEEAIAEVLESGFLTWRLMFIPEPLSVLFLPITQENQMTSVMLVGYRMSESFPKDLIDIYLAVAGLVGTTVAHLTSERELRKHRQHLEELVNERTFALIETNERLQREITQRKRAEEALLGEKDNLIRILEAMEDIVYIVNSRYDIQYANAAFEKEFSYQKNLKCHKTLNDYEEVCPWCPYHDVFAGRTIRWEWNCLKNGKIYDVIQTPLKNADGSVSMLTIFRDITERKHAEETIKQIAYHDALTNLPNRSLFNDRLNLEMAHARRHQKKLALMMLDLDHFKRVNDTLGHDMGDRLLQAVGKRLTSLLRENDTVARLGGDEFMLILPEIATIEDAAKIAEKTVKDFQTPFVLEGRELFVTTSIGIAIYPDDGEDGNALMKKADVAMYHIKQGGRNNYHL
ncbi:MAG: sensor domain-containing diguanylate cyclase [Gammaproteobacteria bacterium]|nr:sensor domain-containing diguanylate cyclase [Gammaproteobacteria bacterium]